MGLIEKYTSLEVKKYKRRNIFACIVPGTGFEPAHPCERCDLNTVRLPISPPGHSAEGRQI